jgi:N-acetyl-gamma-glutamylphosphate reductase
MMPAFVAMEGAGAFIEKGIKVIDLGADFRLNDKTEYQQWYELEHRIMGTKCGTKVSPTLSPANKANSCLISG